MHGRYDIVCPVESAFELHAVWPNSKLKILETAGHSLFEPETANYAIDIMNQLKTAKA